jgi:hypothetical protein
MRPTYVAQDVEAVTRDAAELRIDHNGDWQDAVRETLTRLGLEHEVA